MRSGEDIKNEIESTLQQLTGLAGESADRALELRRKLDDVVALLQRLIGDSFLPSPCALRINEDRTTGLKTIREFTDGATRLTIIDPYIYHADRKDAQNYVTDLCSACRIPGNKQLRSVHIIHDAARTTKTVRTQIRKRFDTEGVGFSEAATSEIHDRVWIKDDQSAIVTGTSINGIGKRLSFLLDLPNEDLCQLKTFLSTKGLQRGPR